MAFSTHIAHTPRARRNENSENKWHFIYGRRHITRMRLGMQMPNTCVLNGIGWKAAVRGEGEIWGSSRGWVHYGVSRGIQREWRWQHLLLLLQLQLPQTAAKCCWRTCPGKHATQQQQQRQQQQEHATTLNSKRRRHSGIQLCKHFNFCSKQMRSSHSLSLSHSMPPFLPPLVRLLVQHTRHVDHGRSAACVCACACVGCIRLASRRWLCPSSAVFEYPASISMHCQTSCAEISTRAQLCSRQARSMRYAMQIQQEKAM